jgi:hypothetical protein
MDYLATKHVMKKHQTAKHRITCVAKVDWRCLEGHSSWWVWPKPPRILRNGHWPSADVKALSVIGLCSCLGRWGGWFSENMMISQYFFNNWTTKMKCTVAKHGNMNTNNQYRWGKKHCINIRKTEPLRRPATFEPLDKHMISAGTNFRLPRVCNKSCSCSSNFLHEHVVM